MNDQTTEKFAALLANCAVNGQADELRKEAAAHELVKEAISPWLVAGPLAGMAAGGAAGYFGTDDEKRKKRNALYGAMSGGLLGLGVPLMAGAGQLTGGNMAGTGGAGSTGSAAGSSATGAGGSGGPATVADKSKPKPSGVLSAYDIIPKWLQPYVLMPEGSKSPLVPGNITDPENPQYEYSRLNWHNWPARALGFAVPGGIGRFAGSVSGRAVDAVNNTLNERREILKQFLRTKKDSGGGQNWKTDTSRMLRRVQLMAAKQKFNPLDPLRRLFGVTPAAYTAAAERAVGARPFTQPEVRPTTPEQKAEYQKALQTYLNKKELAKTLAQTAYTETAPRSITGREKLHRALFQALTPNKRRNFVDAETFVGGSGRSPTGQLPDGVKPITPSTRARTIGRRVGGWGGGIGGALFMDPTNSEKLLDYFIGAPAARAEAERLKAEQNQ